MSRVIQQQVDIHGVPLHHGGAEVPVVRKHKPELLLGELQHLHGGQRPGDQGALDLIVLTVIARKQRARAVEGDDFSPAVFVLHVVLGHAGEDIVHRLKGALRPPQIVSAGEGAPAVGLGEKVVLKGAEILGKETAGRQHRKPPAFFPSL